MPDSDQVAHDAAEELFAAWERWDLDTVDSVVADDAVDERPQSGERFVGRGNIMGMYAEVPGTPRIRWRTIVGGPAAWVAEGIVDYGEGPVNIVGIVELADGNEQSPLLFRRSIRPTSRTSSLVRRPYRLTRWQPQSAVKADNLAVEQRILNDRGDEHRVLFRSAEPRRMWHLRLQDRLCVPW
jgi:hypothetical protein